MLNCLKRSAYLAPLLSYQLLETRVHRFDKASKLNNVAQRSICFAGSSTRSLHQVAGASKKTTGWTEQSRNDFHPGDVITAIRGCSGFSPHGMLGATELAVHVLHEGREYCQPHVDEEGTIHGFYFNVVPRIKSCQPYLRAKFPDLARYADSLTDERLDEFRKLPDPKKHLIEDVEKRFGKIVCVEPKDLTFDDVLADPFAEALQEERLSGKRVAVITPENISNGTFWEELLKQWGLKKK